MHAGIAGRVFAAVGPPSRPTQIIHDGIAGAVYFAVDHGLRSAGRVGGAVASEVWGREGDQSLESWGRAAGPIAAVNGIYGDQMASHSDGLVLTMQIRRHGSAIPMTKEALAAAFPEATGRLAVFVHGWCLTERTWWRRPRTGDDARSYGERLFDDLGLTSRLPSLQHRVTHIGQRATTCRHVGAVTAAMAGAHRRTRSRWPLNGRLGGAQRMLLRCTAASFVDRRDAPCGVPGFAPFGCGLGKGRQCRRLGTGVAARNPGNRGLSQHT